jgi:hypothetical protein
MDGYESALELTAACFDFALYGRRAQHDNA